MIKAQLGSKLPTAPKAEIRYQNGVKDSVAYLGVPFKDSSYFGESIKRVKTPENASIERRILFRHYPYDNDTIYTEIPEHSKYKMYPIKTKVQPRQATNSDVKYVKRNKDGFISYIPTTPSDEYATLQRRFDTAWGVAKHLEGNKIKLSPTTPFNYDPKITYKTPEFVPTYNKTVPEVNVISAKLPGVEVTAPDLSKTLRFPYGGINVVSKSINGGLDRKQRTFVNPFEGHDLVTSKLEGGHIERGDNTRVLHIPNNGEAVYEKTPQGIGDFLPLVGTYRAALRIDKGEPNASYGDFIMNGAMDLLGARMIMPVFKALGKANKIGKALKSRGFIPGSEEGIYIKQGATGTINRASGNVKLVPTVDFTSVAMLPLVQSLRVPATVPFK